MEEEEERQNLPGEEHSGRGGGGAWSWGAGSEGQLATGRLDDEPVPQFLPSLSSVLPISQIACGGAHAIALTSNGSVMTWGRGKSGQLGHGDSENQLQPKVVELLKDTVIRSVAAGWNHSGFVSDIGCLYTCGDGSYGQLGHGDYETQSLPLKVLYFNSKHVAQVTFGMRHSLVLLEAGPPGELVYSFGSARHGQLGVAVEKGFRSYNLPQVVNGFGEDHITVICANGDQSAALSGEGHLYTWGRGFGGTSNIPVPQLLTSHLAFSQVALGWNHALLLTYTGEVFMLVGARHGKFSGSEFKNLESVGAVPHMHDITALYGLKATMIAAGAEHSVLVSECGDIMSWGWGEHGQLGLGGTCDQATPQIVRICNRPSNSSISFRVYCGSGFTFTVGAT
ncbi:ultraviolet-B receptor UVR8 isoform X1 [Nymphaea colorata]|nr:ultraviolet-B receptor UVR8 isoform X1 [Nymphaea colorata]